MNALLFVISMILQLKEDVLNTAMTAYSQKGKHLHTHRDLLRLFSLCGKILNENSIPDNRSK